MSKVILISGGSDGLGKAIAVKLSPNHKVIILSHNLEKLTAVAKEINCDFVEAEIADFDSVKTAVDKVLGKYQKIDVLINNAGIWMQGKLEDNDPEKIRELIGVNVLGYLYLTKACLPSLRNGSGGRIINIVSQDGVCTKKDRSVYTTSKWALTGFTKSLQEDLHGSSVGVTGIYPGLLKTSLFKKHGVERDLTGALDPAEVASFIEYVINLSPDVLIPDVGIKNINNPNNMDDNSSPQIDIDLNPDMMTTQSGIPTVTPPQTVTTTVTTTAPVNPEPQGTSVIDITPDGSTAQNTHPPKIEDITPGGSASLAPTPVTPELTQPSTPPLNPVPSVTTTISTPVSTPPLAQATPPTPPTTAQAPAPWAAATTVKVELPPATPNPLQEDPDQVKINK